MLTHRCRYNPFLRPDDVGVAIGFSDPVFRSQFKQTHGIDVEDDMRTAAAEWIKAAFPGTSRGWEDVKFLQKHWDGKLQA